jgi:hypothetical protein
MACKFIGLALTLYLVISLVGCAPQGNTPIQVFFGTVEQDHYSGIHEPIERAIRTQEEWEDFSERHASKINLRPRTIDFIRFSLIAVFLGERKDGRSSVQITSVTKEANHLAVTYREMIAGDNCIYPSVATYPFHIVAVQHFELPIQFQKQIETYDCSNPVSFTTIEQGADSKIYDSLEHAMQTRAEWETFWQKHNSGRSQKPLPTVDFTRETIITVFVGGRTRGGYLAEIAKIVLDVNRLVVVYKEVIAGDYCVVTLIATQPYHIVKLQRTDLPVAFQKQTEIHDCPQVS